MGKIIQKMERIYHRRWTVEQLTEAVTIAGEIGYQRAAEQTGIPFSTLRHHARRHRLIKPTRDTPEMKEFKKEVRKKAIEKASNYFYIRMINLAADLYEAAEEAVAKTRKYLESIKRPSKEDALWIKSLVAVWDNAIQSGQLLSNKPTSREEQVNKHEFEFVEKVTSDPILTKQLQKILSEKADNVIDVEVKEDIN